MARFLDSRFPMRSRQLPSFFVAEDDPNDMFLLTRLLKGCGAANPLHLALHGEEAIELLSRVIAGNGLADQPSIVFLDIRMPKRSGLEVLAWARQQPALASVPVVVLSAADEPEEVMRARELGAQCFLRKFPSARVIGEVLAAAARFNERPDDSWFELPANLMCRKPGAANPRDGASMTRN